MQRKRRKRSAVSSGGESEAAMVNLILATNNQHKADEIYDIFNMTDLRFADLEVWTQKDAEIDVDVEETGTTYEENAALKAQAVWDAAKAKGMTAYVLAEDSGLEVEALDGGPGIYTKRWAGEHATDDDRIDLLLKKLRHIDYPHLRMARYVCTACVIDPKGERHFFRGEVLGDILKERRGTGGFGYDPVFRWLDRTFAQMSPAEKNLCSHRYYAMIAAANYFMYEFAED